MLTKERRVEIERENTDFVRLNLEEQALAIFLARKAVDDCLREIDERGRLIKELAEALEEELLINKGQRGALLHRAEEVHNAAIQEDAGKAHKIE